jgi:hypothetical protein
MMTSDLNEGDPETYHKNGFMESMGQEKQLQVSLRHLQACILFNPGNTRYRNALTMFADKSRKYSNALL